MRQRCVSLLSLTTHARLRFVYYLLTHPFFSHTITGGWGDYEGPLCVGHEVIGKAVRVGKDVKEIKEGDRVGVGAQVWSCLKCPQCKSANENYCPRLVVRSTSLLRHQWVLQ